jgi:AmmeMemoRadiSam system protein A
VSYAVIAVTAPAPLSAPPAGPTEQKALEPEQMSLLHQVAVAGVALAVAGDRPEVRDRLDRLLAQIPSSLKTPAGAFVTLRQDGRLRGCIGYILPRRPLYRAVLENGVNAAQNDHRFRPVTPEELDGLTIEVSVLTPPRPIASYLDFRVGKQGIVLSKEGRQAVFLPEVALEQGWTREQTLSNLSRKAGLPPSAWREGAFLQVFENQKYAGPYRQ